MIDRSEASKPIFFNSRENAGTVLMPFWMRFSPNVAYKITVLLSKEKKASRHAGAHMGKHSCHICLRTCWLEALLALIKRLFKFDSLSLAHVSFSSLFFSASSGIFPRFKSSIAWDSDPELEKMTTVWMTEVLDFRGVATYKFLWACYFDAKSLAYAQIFIQVHLISFHCGQMEMIARSSWVILRSSNKPTFWKMRLLYCTYLNGTSIRFHR